MAPDRRAVLNAVLTGRDPFEVGLRPSVVSWHLIWLHHEGRVRITRDGFRPGRQAVEVGRG